MNTHSHRHLFQRVADLARRDYGDLPVSAYDVEHVVDDGGSTGNEHLDKFIRDEAREYGYSS